MECVLLQATGGPWQATEYQPQPTREELLNNFIKRVEDFETLLPQLRGIEYTYSQQRRLTILWVLAALELDEIAPHQTEIAVFTGYNTDAVRVILKEFLEKGMINRGPTFNGKKIRYIRYFYTLKDEYLLELWKLNFQ